MALAALTEARHYVVDLACRRGLDDAVCIEALDSLLSIVQVVDDDLLEPGREEAQALIRDPEDWPTLDLRHCGAFSGPIKEMGLLQQLIALRVAQLFCCAEA